jgi:hypothetical protein
MSDRKRCDECGHYRHSVCGHPYWGNCKAEWDAESAPKWLVRVARLQDGTVPCEGYDEGCPRWEKKR